MIRTLAVFLLCLPVLAADERPESAPEGEAVPVRLRYPPGLSQKARFTLAARFDSAALGLAFDFELAATGELEARDDAQIELALAVESCTLNRTDVPRAAGQRALLRVRLDDGGRPVPGSLHLQVSDAPGLELVATWCEALFLHLPAGAVRTGEVWDLPLTGAVAAVPLPDGTRLDLSGWQRLKETDGHAGELDAGLSGSVDDLPVRLPVTGVRTTLDAALEGEGETAIAGDGTVRRLRLDGRARVDVDNPSADQPLPARASFTVELRLDPPAGDDS